MEDVLFQDFKESERINHWNSVNSEYTETNMHGDAIKNNGTTGGENSFETLKQPDASQNIIRTLTDQLEKCNHEIVQLKANIDHQAVQERNYQKEKQDIINERNNLLKILYQKNNLIDRMASDIKILEAQLKSAVSEKFDALIRLTAIEGNVQTLSFQNAISEIEDAALTQTFDSSDQKVRNEQEQCRNESRDEQSMDDAIAIHSEKMQQSQVDGHITHQSEILDQTKSPAAEKVKDHGYLLSQEETTEKFENGDPVGISPSRDRNMTVERNKNKRAPEDMDVKVDVVTSQNDFQNIGLDLLSEVRTRGQNQFLRDAFRSIEPTDKETKDTQKRVKIHNGATHTPSKSTKRGRGRKRES